MDAQRNIVARFLNNFFSGNATTYSVCVVELHVTVNQLKILRVAQQRFYEKFMSPATIKQKEDFKQSAQTERKPKKVHLLMVYFSLKIWIDIQ